MILFNYKHTQRKLKLETFFIKELEIYLNDLVEQINIDFSLDMDDKLRTRECIEATLYINGKRTLFVAKKIRFRKSAVALINEIAHFLEVRNKQIA